MKQITLTIPERIAALKALSIKTGLIDSILLEIVKRKISFTPEEIEWSRIIDGKNGEVLYDFTRPVNKIVQLADCEINLLKDRFGATAQFQEFKNRLESTTKVEGPYIKI